MRYVVIVILLLAALLIWPQVVTKSRPNGSSAFELKISTQVKHGGIRPYAESVYTLIEKRSQGDHERWRITQHDKHAHHWIAPSGTVWVLTDGMPGPGGAARLWVRDANADLKGVWGVHELSSNPSTPGGFSQLSAPSNQVDINETKAVTLASNSEQLRLVLKDGSEVRLTIARTQNEELVLLRKYPAGQPKVDLLTEKLDQPGNHPVVEWPANKVPIAVWTCFGPGRPEYVVQTYGIGANLNTGPRQTIRAERILTHKPTYVARTPGAKVLWFEFGELWEKPEARLDLLNYQGDLVQSIDLLKLGKFPSSEAAKKSISYRDIIDRVGYATETLDTDQMYGADTPESLSFSDRTGRKYRVDIQPEGTTFKVTADASLRLDSVGRKEPTYPDANLISQLSETSASGRFRVELKTYTARKKTQGQLTLTTKLKDPIEGEREVELWSKTTTELPKSFRVSDSGRVYTLTFGRHENINGTGASRDFGVLHSWEPSGRQLGGMDLMQWKWFATLEQARRQFDLKNMKIEFDGIVGEIEVDGVPIPVWPQEKLTLPLGNGESKRLYIQAGYDALPSIMSFEPIKKSGR